MDNVSIIAEPGQKWDRVFEEIAQAFADALAGAATQLVFGAHLLREPLKNDDGVIYQSEQISETNSWCHADYIKNLRTHEVWDYSPHNVERLRLHGIQAKLAPIRYMPCMTKFSSLPSEQQDIDVLFYGSTNKRRLTILNDLIRAGLRVHKLYRCFGAERDAWIARSKIVLNTHMSDNGIFEIFRCSHLFANRKCVISETGSDEALERLYHDCAVWCRPQDLVGACVEYAENQAARSVQEFRALDAFKTPTLKSEIGKALPWKEDGGPPEYPILYSHACPRCGRIFIGWKRREICQLCAAKEQEEYAETQKRLRED